MSNVVYHVSWLPGLGLKWPFRLAVGLAWQWSRLAAVTTSTGKCTSGKYATINISRYCITGLGIVGVPLFRGVHRHVHTAEFAR